MNSKIAENTNSSKISAPQISLSKGGGAIKGIGETFQPNPFSGTGSLSIPIYTSPCRGFEPQLSLDYSSGLGNGIFGIGFGLSIPNISRKTEWGIPKYDDSDIFIISSADNLVPKLVGKKNGKWELDRKPSPDQKYDIMQYRPRVEGLFAKIGKWVKVEDSDIHWRVTTEDNITSIYGQSQQARIADETHVFQWLIEETHDAKGNKIAYEYKAEDLTSNDINEINRTQTANKYIHKIKYGHYLDGWHFEVVFDYGERSDLTVYEPSTPWSKRCDSFSSYKSGFEIRTHRLRRNVLMFHRFKSEFNNDTFLVRAMSFKYDETSTMTFLKGVTSVGYRKKDDGTYDTKELPPLKFSYSTFDPKQQQSFKPLTIAKREWHPRPHQPGRLSDGRSVRGRDFGTPV